MFSRHGSGVGVAPIVKRVCADLPTVHKTTVKKKIEGAQLSLTVAPGRWVHEKCSEVVRSGFRHYGVVSRLKLFVRRRHRLDPRRGARSLAGRGQGSTRDSDEHPDQPFPGLSDR